MKEEADRMRRTFSDIYSPLDTNDRTEEEKKKALLEDIEEYLNEHDQTPQLHVNYIIQTVALNGIWEDLCY